MFTTQISVYLENNKGTLRTLTKVLGENNIDILALSIADTSNFGIVRIVVREVDIDNAIKALKSEGFIAKTNSVLCIAVANKSAGLDSALAVVEENNISIDYMYSLNYNIGSKALIMLKLSSDGMDKEQIASLLDEKDVKIVKQEEINIL